MSDFYLKRLANVVHKYPKARYLAYIRSPQWSRRRREHLELMDGWCEVCHKAKACQVHHWTYIRLGQEYPQDLCSVCVTCHHKLHCMVMPPVADNDNQLELPLRSVSSL